MRAVACRAGARLGRRGAYLLVAGVGWLLYGVGVIQDPRAGTVRAAVVLSEAAPLSWWGCLWITCGAIAIVTAWSRCPLRQTAGYAAAMLPPLLWATAYAAAWLLGEYPRAWTGAATWAGAAAKLLIVAGWPEPARVPEVARE
ncbi:hypothetical protein [Streptomyces xiamenensis]|uniref:hypothetical protein n=1 Tax=Streptomyces xiamenensis TaxID=408015 RepID=UPI003D764139